MIKLIHSKTFQNLFVFGLFIIVIITVLTRLFDWLAPTTLHFSPLQETVFDTLIILLTSGILAWLLSIPMLLKISQQQAKDARQNKENAHLNQALNAHSLVCFINTDGVISYVNDQFCILSGYSKNELIGENYSLINANYLNTALVNDIERVINKGKPWKGEQYLINKQKSVYWVDSTIVAMLNHIGESEGFSIVSRDITQTKKDEIHMLSLKRALDASTEMVIVTDDNNHIQYINSAVNDMTGWKKEDLIGKPTSIFNSPDCDLRTLQDIDNHLKQGKSWSGRMLNRRKGMLPINIAGQTTPPDTKEYWVNMNITPIRDSKDNHMGYIQIQRDITKRVNAELAQEMEKYDTAARISIANVLQQTSPLKKRMTEVLEILFELQDFNLQRKGGIFLKNPEQDCLDMYLLLGQFSDEFICREERIPLGACLCGRSAVSQELIVSDDCFCDPRHDHHFEGMQAHGHYIVPIVSADTTLGILFLYTDPYPSALESRLIKLQQVGDMLALALLQEQVKQSLELARDNAEQTAKTKTDFLANMSHEIRTPLNGVLNMLDILRDTPLDTEQHDLIDVASDSAESLLVIINGILDFSKLEAGKVDLETIEFDLPCLVEEVCTLMSKSAHTKDLELNCFLPPDLQKIWLGDPTRVRQILTNLVGNAIKFTQSGEVSVRVKVESFKNTEQKTLLFIVKDTGIGIPLEVQALLFKPFSQADSSTARRFGGTGLGLSISKTLISNMNGKIGVESTVNQGSSFWFTLPLQASDKETEPSLPFDFSGKRALIVDDNQTNRRILTHYLNFWKMETTSADDAPQALLCLSTAAEQQNNYDIILSDLHMPDMDGFAFAKQINNMPSIASTPRLLLSSGGLPTKNKLIEMGFSQSLLKPIRRTQLFNAIAATLNYIEEKTIIPTEDSKALANYSHKKVLVVEDNKTNQIVILGMLKKLQIIPDLEENGQHALDRIAHNNYDLVLMDCQMPVLDGYEATRKLRDKEATHHSPRVPIIALTAHAAIGEREKCLAAGMDDYLTKPLSKVSLRKILHHWLGESVIVEKEPTTQQHPLQNIVTNTNCWDKSAALKLIDNDEEILTDMIDIFMSGISEFLSDLDNAITQNDLSSLANVAHTIKGIAGQLCAEHLTTLASDLEIDARAENAVDFNALVKNISQAMNDLTDELK